MNHIIYSKIIFAVKNNKLQEPFRPSDLKSIGIKTRTAYNFPSKHRKNNPSKASELFIQLKDGTYKLIHPFKYDLN